MTTKHAPPRYHSALVTLHWLIALLILTEALIGLGFHFHRIWAPLQTEIQIHMILGIAILAAALVRIVVRLVTPKPLAAFTGNRFLDLVGKATHVLLYLFVVALTGSAVLSAYKAKILRNAIGQLGLHYGNFDLRLHLLLFLGLAVLVGLHVAAAFYHQLVRRDGLFARMGYGKAAEKGADEGRPQG